MFLLVGYLFGLISVFGAYAGMGGHMGALYQPLELLLIAGSALGAFVASNNQKSFILIKDALPKLFRRAPYDKALYLEMMACLYTILNKAKREGVMKIEGDIEDPENSQIFKQYKQISDDKRLLDFIIDYLRLMISGKMSPFEIETLMDEEIETYKHESKVPSKAFRAVGDGMPAFGIVAAVLGVIKALAAVDQPPEILADLISKAMVGTFLGILIAYLIMFPMSDALERRASESSKALETIKVTLLAFMNNYPPQIAVEFGRKVLYSAVRPSFVELEAHIQKNKAAGRSDKAESA